MPFEVTNLGTDWKPICNFLYVYNINLILSHIVSTISQVIGQIYGVNRWCFSSMHLFGVNPKIQDCEIWRQETRHTAVS